MWEDFNMFTPYHRFRGCLRFKREFKRLSEAGSISDSIQQLHNRYHYALFHKLKSGKYHLENLERLLSSTPPQDVVSLDTSSEFLFNTNLHIDNFFYSTGSALDILSREILSYFGIPFPPKVYFHTAYEELSRLRPGDQLLQRLDSPSWKEEFSNYRNALTHELLVVGRYSLDVQVDGGNPRQIITVPLPDNPREDMVVRTYKKNPDAKNYCADTFRRVVSLINQIYSEITDRMVTLNHLPL